MSAGSSFMQSQDNTWARLDRHPALGNLPGIFCTPLEWEVQGVDLTSLGLLHIGPAMRTALGNRQTVEVPVLKNIHVSLLTQGEVQFLAMGEGSHENPPVLASSVFTDEHPQEWLDMVQSELRLFVAVGRLGPNRFNTFGEWADTWSVAVAPVAQWLDGRGVWMTPPT